jgi:hypothetical protein
MDIQRLIKDVGKGTRLITTGCIASGRIPPNTVIIYRGWRAQPWLDPTGHPCFGPKEDRSNVSFSFALPDTPKRKQLGMYFTAKDVQYVELEEEYLTQNENEWI